jgi:hypothetical protein
VYITASVAIRHRNPGRNDKIRVPPKPTVNATEERVAANRPLIGAADVAEEKLRARAVFLAEAEDCLEEPLQVVVDSAHALQVDVFISRVVNREDAATSTHASNFMAQELQGQDVTVRDAPDPVAVVCRFGDFESATPFSAEMTAHLDRGADREFMSR